MPHANVNGLRLYYEEAGSGTPLLFVHEFAGDYRSWEDQMRFFARRYRAITFSARGYLPSDVPEGPEQYGQTQQVDDVRGLLDALEIRRAHVCGLSMGSYTTLLFGLAHPERALSLAVAGCGYGSGTTRKTFHGEVEAVSERMLKEGMGPVADTYTLGPARVQFQNKDPAGWRRFRDYFAEHSAKGSAYTLRAVQMQRPSVYDVESRLRSCEIPTLILNGDEDEPCLEPGLFMKRAAPSAGQDIFPKTGHTLNLEEPGRFNQSVLAFLTAAEQGKWPMRDPRSQVNKTV
jgi:pimeloyl-ACP methyl ester carboxylesterase